MAAHLSQAGPDSNSCTCTCTCTRSRSDRHLISLTLCGSWQRSGKERTTRPTLAVTIRSGAKVSSLTGLYMYPVVATGFIPVRPVRHFTVSCSSLVKVTDLFSPGQACPLVAVLIPSPRVLGFCG